MKNAHLIFSGIVSLFASTASLAQIAVKDADFTSGIGIYMRSDKGLIPLTWPTDSNKITKAPDDEHIFSSFSGMYTYGLNFASGGIATLPPHVLGYQWGYIDLAGESHGDWAVRFHPVEGLKQPTYELFWDGPVDDLISGKVAHRTIYMKLPGGKAFLFKLDNAVDKEQHKKNIGADAVKYLPGLWRETEDIHPTALPKLMQFNPDGTWVSKDQTSDRQTQGRWRVDGDTLYLTLIGNFDAVIGTFEHQITEISENSYSHKSGGPIRVTATGAREPSVKK